MRLPHFSPSVLPAESMARLRGLRKSVLCRESNEESPESRRLFGAGLGARSPQRTPRGKHGKAKRLTQKRTYAAPPSPFSASLRTPSGSSQRNAQARSELTKPDNCTAFENVLTAIPTYGGIETQHSASCFSFPDEGKETGVIERKTFQQERMAGVRGAQNATCRETPPSPTATPPLSGEATHIAATEPSTPRRQPPARTHACAGAKTGQTQPFAGLQFTDK